jgi:hypothetical protein
MFTGTSLANQGVCAIGRQSIKPKTPTPVPIGDTLDPLDYGSARMIVDNSGPTSLQAVCNLENSIILSASETRCGYDIINVPYTYDYKPRDRNASIMQYSTSGVPGPTFGALYQPNPATAEGKAGASPGFYDAPTTFVSFTGIDAGATVTVTLQACVEYLVGDSSTVARFAKNGPANDPMAIEQVKTIARNVPVTKPSSIDWLSLAGGALKSVAGIASKALTGVNLVDAVEGLIGGVRNMAVRNNMSYARAIGATGNGRMIDFPLD